MDTQIPTSNPYGKKVIVVDWGTTSLRCVLIAANGKILAETESQGGIQFVKDRRFEPELMKVISPWLEEHGALPVVALGMITSKNGWVEVPYVPCPATPEDLAHGILSRVLPNGSELHFLAGLTDETRSPFPDVMRGEETQIVGFGLDEELTLVLPGTHSKWAQISCGKVDAFQTFVTGEVFALMSQHSFIAKVAGRSRDDDWDVMEEGALVARESQSKDIAFLTQLFSVRTGMLAGKLKPEQMISYLSGLVIGNEFRQAMDAGWFKPGDTIGVVGNDGLNDRYCRVAQAFDLHVRDGGEHAAVVGALEIFAERRTRQAA